ncbi:hypothetical protein PIB30_075524 [Stylosanthes scabra]|uniref:RRM domain-containing protein n=1 Tax=Stylosanthes scabra TaxID=79078 RepID=A0ABU6ZNR1_9FABA|nr:hypothetical protein [Stylosanthes scabra]
MDGYVKDIYVSRKKRRNSKGTFAFVRFWEYGRVMKAIARLNGKPWHAYKLFVSLSKFRRDGGPRWENMEHEKHVGGQGKRQTQKWIPVKNKIGEGTTTGQSLAQKQHTELCRRKEVQGVWSEEQKERLQRSFLGVCVKLIDFRKVMNRLLEEWNGPGNVECLDVGPYKCLVMFSSPETRDAAMKDELLISIFDEVRPHWELVWSLSRRVWIEIMGLLVNMWCVENISMITKLWGKMILIDDRTEASKSFSIARVLIDSFQWEEIHEWISIKIEDRVLDVFVKEFGSEVYSVESHPDRGVIVSETMDATNSMPMVEESRMEVETSPVTDTCGNLNLKFVVDPLIDVINNSILDYVHQSNYGRENDGGEHGKCATKL